MVTSLSPDTPAVSYSFFNQECGERCLTITTVACAILATSSLAAFLITSFTWTLIPATIFSIAGLASAIAGNELDNKPLTIRGELIHVMNETLNAIQNRHDFGHSANRSASQTRVLQGAGSVYQRPGAYPTTIHVKDQDCLYAAEEMSRRGLNPLVLDMACNTHFGGGYLTGAKAQEEECCRRSTLSVAVDTQHGVQKTQFYPLTKHSAAAGLHVPAVTVFRSGNDQNYRYLDHPFNVSFGIYAAKNRPSLDYSSGKPRMSDEDAADLREKIRGFFHMAYCMGHDSVVFGALGCGAYRNPPEQVAEIAFDVIKHEFAHCFKEITIAIKDDHNAHLSHNLEGNFRPFARQALANGGKVFNQNGQNLTRV